MSIFASEKQKASKLINLLSKTNYRNLLWLTLISICGSMKPFM